MGNIHLKLFKKRIDICSEVFCGGLIAAMVAVVTAQVIWRYFIGLPLVWAEETARLFFIWASFLGASIAIRKRGNIAIDIILSILPARARTIWDRVIDFICLFFSVFMIFGSIELLEVGWIQPSAALQIPMAIFTLAIPVSGALITIDLGLYLLSSLKRQI